ncbi:sensor histidine kinase [Paracoccus suum]|nr:sensor histidine kinase [Paracoccus suum]
MNGLGFRLGFLLSLAILPIGLISLMQTLNLSREAERAREVALLGRTAAAAAGERALIQGALGTADALGPAVLERLDDPAACAAIMRGFVQRNATYVYAGFTGMDGITSCNSGGVVLDVSDTPTFQKFMVRRSTVIAANPNGPVSGRSVVSMAQPVYRDRELLGYVQVSLTHDLLRSTHSSDFGQGTANIVTFANDGSVLSTYAVDDLPLSELLPRNVPLSELVNRPESTFHNATEDGEDRIFAAVPIVPGLAHALGSYSPAESGVRGLAAARAGAVMIPLALWLVSIGVSYLAVYRLVLRHVQELRGQMRRFAIGDRTELPRIIPDAPAELKDVSRTFHNLARILVHDEQQLEEAVAEKTVLLKEVHHRVKNNLQLIASIINMQSRMIDDPDAKGVLRSVQDRVASLATIYRNLYQAEHLDSVAADRLLSDIVSQMSAATAGVNRGIRIETDIQPLTLLPDQAVPLSLLATEALTNALKYASPEPGEDRPWACVVLRLEGPGRALLEVSNSMGAGQTAIEGTGLGGQLIDAFALQLDSEIVKTPEPTRYTISLRFDVHDLPGRSDESRAVVLTSAARQGATH